LSNFKELYKRRKKKALRTWQFKFFVTL